MESLRPESDFTRFMAKDVTPETRRAALKRLFVDAHFNVPDPFEPYSADLTVGEPIPEEMLKTLDHAKRLLAERHSVLDTALASGLSGTGRLHDLFVSHEAMTPGDYKRRGEGLDMGYGFHASPFGEALVIVTERGVAGLAFVDEDRAQTREDVLAEMKARWPKARLAAAPERTALFARQIFDPATWSKDQPVRLVMIGTDFEVRVWEALLRIPMGRAVSYHDIARHLGRKPQSLSPARDGLIKKGLVYSAERGSVGFTVPHFGKFLRSR